MIYEIYATKMAAKFGKSFDFEYISIRIRWQWKPPHGRGWRTGKRVSRTVCVEYLLPFRNTRMIVQIYGNQSTVSAPKGTVNLLHVYFINWCNYCFSKRKYLHLWRCPMGERFHMLSLRYSPWNQSFRILMTIITSKWT